MSNITVYTTSTCPFCDMMKNFLDEKGFPYKEVNVQLDQAAGKKLVETTGEMGVPQTEIDGQWIIGFEPDRVMELVK